MTAHLDGLSHLQEAAKIIRRSARKAEVTAADSGSPVDPRPVLLQAEIAWRMSNVDLAIILYQRAASICGSFCPLKVIQNPVLSGFITLLLKF